MLVLFYTLLASSASLFAQPPIGDLYTTAPYPHYALSPDGKTLVGFHRPANFLQAKRCSKTILASRLGDGKLSYANYDFIRPSESYLQRGAAQNTAWVKRVTPAKPSELPLNALLRTREGFHVLLGQDSNTSKRKAIKYNPSGDGKFSPSETSLAEADSRDSFVKFCRPRLAGYAMGMVLSHR